MKRRTFFYLLYSLGLAIPMIGYLVYEYRYITHNPYTKQLHAAVFNNDLKAAQEAIDKGARINDPLVMGS